MGDKAWMWRESAEPERGHSCAMREEAPGKLDQQGLTFLNSCPQ